MPVKHAHTTITAAVTAWPHISAHLHRFGGTEYIYGDQREIGHIHGDHLVDIPFPTHLRTELIEQGRAEPHHLLPDSGWISFYLRQPDDVDKAIELLRLSYAVAAKQKSVKSEE
jgi:predicted DNA-binding protein (MmcQ/YjbR family)